MTVLEDLLDKKWGEICHQISLWQTAMGERENDLQKHAIESGIRLQDQFSELIENFGIVEGRLTTIENLFGGTLTPPQTNPRGGNGIVKMLQPITPMEMVLTRGVRPKTPKMTDFWSDL